MPTILSRFDMIFIVKDVHDQGKDMVCGVYILHGCRYENESVLCLCCGCRDELYVHSVTLIWSLPSEPMRLLTLWHITIEND